MSTNTKANEVVVLTTSNKVEVIRTSALRRLVSAPSHHLLLTYDEHNRQEIYILDAANFEKEYVASYGESEDAATQLAVIASALFRCLLAGGHTFRVLGKGTSATELIE